MNNNIMLLRNKNLRLLEEEIQELKKQLTEKEHIFELTKQGKIKNLLEGVIVNGVYYPSIQNYLEERPNQTK